MNEKEESESCRANEIIASISKEFLEWMDAKIETDA